MVRYLSLLTFTEKGIANVKDTFNRAHAFRELVEQSGGKIIAQYWAIGDKDGAVVFEVPDGVTGASVLTRLAEQGYVRTQSMQVFNEAEFRKALGQG